MRPFILLLKVQLLGLFGINKALHADPSKAKRLIALAVLAVAAVVVCVGAYAASVSTALVRLGLADAVPTVAVLVGSVTGAVAAFLKANGVLFAFKDYDVVMSLPVPTSTVVLSRIASLYAMAVAFGLMVMVPAFCVYAAEAGCVSAVGAAFMALSVVLAPLAPLALAVVLAALIAAFSSRFRHANIIVAVLSLVAVLGFIGLALAVSAQTSSMDALTALGADKVGLLAAAYPPAAWASAGIAQGDLLAFSGFALLNMAAALALVVVLVRLFVPVNALLMSTKTRGSFSFEGEGRVRGSAHAGGDARSPFRALLAKEARLLAATPIYLLNACMGYVLVIVGAAALLIAAKSGMLPPDQLPPEALAFLGPYVPWALAFCLGISSTTAAAMSLEGPSRWIMLTAPVPARTVLGAKAALNLMFALPAVVVGGTLVSFALPLDALSLGAVFAVPLAFALFSTFTGLALDVLRPRYDWTSPYEPVKRGMPVFAVVFGGMLLVGAGIAATALAGPAASLALAAVVAVASIMLFRQVERRGIAI